MTNKEQFDTAIKLLETIVAPENQPRDRNFDFRRDYVVQTRLGQTLYKRSQLESDPKAEQEFLRRAIAAYEKALEVDPENVDAHYGLYQCYEQFARNVPEAPKAEGTPTAAALQLWGDQLADASKRAEAAKNLLRDVPGVFESAALRRKKASRVFAQAADHSRLAAATSPGVRRGNQRYHPTNAGATAIMAAQRIEPDLQAG